MKNIRVHLIVEGRVQGVWFRESTRITATELDVKGWVRNRSDGSVEIIAEGQEENIMKFIEWCHDGPPHAVVIKVTQTPREYRNEFNSFTIVF